MTLEDKEVNELLPTHWRRTYSPAAYLAPLSVSPLAESGTERRGPQNCAACVLQAACLDVWMTTCQQEGFDSCLATGSSCGRRRCRASSMWRLSVVELQRWRGYRCVNLGFSAGATWREERLTLRNHPFNLRTLVVVSSPNTELGLDILHNNWWSFEDGCRDEQRTLQTTGTPISITFTIAADAT